MMRSVGTLFFLSVIVLAAFSWDCGVPSAPETPEYDKNAELAAEEWRQVKQAVQTMFVEAQVDTRDLQKEPRIDWENSAYNPELGTRNMTGSVNEDGSIPLVALIPNSSGTIIRPVSNYLGKDRTNSLYWIDNRGGVHLCEGSFALSDEYPDKD